MLTKLFCVCTPACALPRSLSKLIFDMKEKSVFEPQTTFQVVWLQFDAKTLKNLPLWHNLTRFLRILASIYQYHWSTPTYYNKDHSQFGFGFYDPRYVWNVNIICLCTKSKEIEEFIQRCPCVPGRLHVRFLRNFCRCWYATFVAL